MRPGEMVVMAAENLWRLKMRAVLTTAGVMIGVGALIAMLAFSVGMRRNLTGEFERLGLLRSLMVTASREESGATSTPRALDNEAVREIEAIPGVAAAYPQLSFDADVTMDGRTEKAAVQGLPEELLRQRPLAPIVAGRLFAAGAREAVVSLRYLERLGVTAESAIGQTLNIEAAGVGTLASGIASQTARRFGFASQPGGLFRGTMELLVEMVWPSRASLTVVGVADARRRNSMRVGEVLVPIEVAQGIDHLSFSNPVELLAMLSAPAGEGWRLVLVSLADQRDSDRVREQIEALGFGVFSFLDMFREARRFFLLADGLIGALGLMALCIAALGIVNTMLMSVLERVREIGILKSLGVEEGEIRLLFLAESAMIGLVGSLLGIGLGWVVSRMLAWVFMVWMESQGVPRVDIFELTPLSTLGAVAFGVTVSILAGLYPAARAARVDPVVALRAG